jgi:murein DD-endopeptidase MepM/ murein hydrolase activator NlpD
MQMIWMAGPAAKVVTLSITTRTVLAALASAAGLLLLIGFLFHMIGLRVAVEYAPGFVQRLAGVTSQTEQQQMEATYRQKLEDLNQQLSGVTNRLRQMETIKNEALGRLGLEKLLSISGQNEQVSKGPRGGPLLSLPEGDLTDKILLKQLDKATQKMREYDQNLSLMHDQWEADLGRLDQLPTALPLAGAVRITSSFGVRPDPVTHLPSMHEGVDFVAPVGTPVLATAAGVVLRSEYAGAYGYMVEVAHAEGFVTRYAHLKTLHVKANDVLKRHERVGTLGNTGRSTGPHLHYEVIYKGQAMHPVKALATWSQAN